MIRVIRGPEPAELEQQRWWRLARLRAALLQHRALQHLATPPLPDFKFLDHHFEGYKVEPVRESLRCSQHRKCAYCERWEEEIAHPVEHFRPKNGAVRSRRGAKPRLVERSCYWWLAWTWENLLFSCGACNSKSFKANNFPITGPALAEGSTALAAEAALLIDPARVEPLEHIRFIPVTANGMTNWKPVPRTDTSGRPSAQGEHTIHTLGLDRPDLIDLYNAHVASLDDSLVRVENAIRGGQATHISNCWEQAIDEHVWCVSSWGLDKPFAALSYDVFCYHFPLTRRQPYGLRLPRPGQRPQPAPPPTHTAPLTFSADQQLYADETRWAMRAVGPRSSGDHDSFLTEALRAILNDPHYNTKAPMSAAALCALLSHPFPQDEAQVAAALAALAGQGAAGVDGQGGWSV